jgi:hypothetical protein
MKNAKRVLAALFGSILFSIIVPIAYFFAFDQPPLDGLKGIALLAGVGVTVGAILGALFPRVFGFVFEVFFDV